MFQFLLLLLPSAPSPVVAIFLSVRLLPGQVEAAPPNLKQRQADSHLGRGVCLLTPSSGLTAPVFLLLHLLILCLQSQSTLGEVFRKCWRLLQNIQEFPDKIKNFLDSVFVFKVYFCRLNIIGILPAY